jgi:hypothetical protein
MTAATANTHRLSVKLIRTMSTRDLRRMERQVRRLALDGQLDRAGLVVWAATRMVLRDRGVRLPSSESRRRWWRR